MQEIRWKPSIHGGWFHIDEDGNYWHKTSNGEQITIKTTDGRTGSGWTAQQALEALNEAA